MQTLKDKEISNNKQALDKISLQFNQKYYSSLSCIQQLYANTAAYSDLVYFLTHEYGDYISNRLDVYSISESSQLIKYQTYFDAYYSNDKDINSIILYSKEKKSFYAVCDRNGPRTLNLSPEVYKLMDKLLFNNVEPATGFYKNNLLSPSSSQIYSTIRVINDPNTLENIGVVIINYNTNKIYESYNSNSSDKKGDFLVITKRGDVIFDSTEKYYGKKYPYFNLIKESQEPLVLEKKSYVNIIRDSNSGIITLGLLPQDIIISITKPVRNTIFLITALFIIVSLVLTYSVIQAFSRRIKLITHGMEALKKGNLTSRIPVGKNDDELTQIAVNFNSMCDSLDDHIKRVYLSEINQKNAELLALQSQINPHFLYNTLEVIRMKAVSTGAANIGEMIYSLAALFRDTAKGATFITISEEIEHCKLYLHLFKIRYEDRLKFDIKIPEEYMNYGIVKFTLQPVIENYVLHGIKYESDDNLIQISVKPDQNDLIFSVTDNGTGINEHDLDEIKRTLEENTSYTAKSIGLPNVNGRLKMLYGSEYGIDIQSEPGNGTVVIIRIPAMKKEEMIHLCTKFS
jgi:two-component system sensor histidine kinase YesM